MSATIKSLKGIPRLAAVAVLVLVIVLLVVLALVVAARRRVPVLGGAAGAAGGAHKHFGELRLEQALARARQEPPPAPGPLMLADAKKHEVLGGAKWGAKGGAARPKKPWTGYPSWAELRRDREAWREYINEGVRVLGELELDWTGVMKQLQKTFEDTHEWAGRINIVDGKPKIVELVRSTHDPAKDELGRGEGAVVPAEIMSRLAGKPAAFLFHTHPNSGGGGTVLPSPTDITAAAWLGVSQEFMAELMISECGVFMYTPSPQFRKEVWAAGNGLSARLATARRVADMHAALNGNRSWNTPWEVKDYIAMVEKYGMLYYVFPTYKYPNLYYRSYFSTEPSTRDLSAVAEYHSMIEEFERELAEAGKKAPKKQEQKKRKR